HLTGHAHIDMNWLWVWDETLEVLKRDFASMMALMEEFPQYKYSHSQAATYRAIETNAPELFSKLKKFVQNKQWEITASMWVEGDENLASGEALVRQFLLGKRYIMKKFDVEPTVCWQPDLFGHIWTMPQILKKCGCDYYFFMRCAKPNTTAFWWQGPDGSKVLAYNTPNYNGTINQNITQLPANLYQSENISEYLHAYGVGDHGGGPNRTDVSKALELQDVPNSASIKFNTVTGFFEDLQKKSTNLPVVHDELQFIFEGCYTTRADIKQRNRQSENILPELELFASMAQPFEFPYPNHVLQKGWERTCFNQFHDILPGSGIHAAYQESLPLADGVIAAAESSLQRALNTLAAKIKSDQFPGKSPLTIFNSTNWVRSDIAKFDVSLTENQWIEIYDADNTIIPCQIVNRNADTATVLFIAQNIPAAGYKTYFWLKTENQPKFETDLTPKGNWTFENHYFQIQLDPATGAMTRIMDKINSTEYIEPGQPANIFQLNYEKPNDMSAWIIGDIERIVDLLDPDKVEVLESGPVRMMIQITHRHDHSEFKQRIVLYSQLPRIDFPCQVEWFEKGSPEKGGVMLKVVFPLNLSPDNLKATFDIPFGFIEREANGHEVPAQKWIDVADSEKGIS
ncbi:alpha-mannosidase, partial [bacterium]|nr:alpha-mannosidase [bacterium]